MIIIEIKGFMINQLDEIFTKSIKFNTFVHNESRRFGKPLTNTYRNQDYINYLKKKGKILLIKSNWAMLRILS